MVSFKTTIYTVAALNIKLVFLIAPCLVFVDELNTFLIMGIGGGVVILIIFVAILICCVRKKKAERRTLEGKTRLSKCLVILFSDKDPQLYKIMSPVYFWFMPHSLHVLIIK